MNPNVRILSLPSENLKIHLKTDSGVQERGKMLKNLLELFSLFFLLTTGVFLSHVVYAQEDIFEEMREFEADIDDEIRWLREEAAAEFISVATKTRMNIQDTPSVVSVITGEQIRDMGARDITDVLRTLPGFDLTQSALLPVTHTGIRGMRSGSCNDKIKIMIDGHHLQAAEGHAFQHFDRLPLASVRRIEIIRGPGSALYGSDAFLGVINIITKEGGDRSSEISFEYGSFETIKPYAELSYKEDDLKVYLYADYYKTDGYDGEIESDMTAHSPVIPGFGPMFAPSESREMDNSGEYNTFQTNISYKDFKFSGFFQKADSKCSVGVTEVLTDEDEVRGYYAYGEISYRTDMADRGNLLLRTYYDYSDDEKIFELFPEETGALYGFPEGEGLHAGNWADLSVAGIEITADADVCPGIQLVGGTSYEHMKQSHVETYGNYNSSDHMIEVDGIPYPPFPYQYVGGIRRLPIIPNKNADRDIFALYAQGLFDLKTLLSLEKGVENLSLTIGGRYDDYDDTGSSTNPRFGIVYAPTERLWFKALYGEAFRAPNFLELYMTGNTFTKGNPDLDPERITTMEALAGYRFTRNIAATLTCFHVSAEDLIQYQSDGEWVVAANVGEMVSVGTEFELKASFGKNKYAYLNFTWQDVRDTTNSKIEGTDIAQEDFLPGTVPDFYGNIGVNWGFGENLIGNMSVNYVGERQRSEEKTWDGEKLVLRDTREPLDERWLLNASLTFRDFFAKGTEFQISGHNLLDEDYRDPYPDMNIENDIPRPGTTFTGRVSYQF